MDITDVACSPPASSAAWHSHPASLIAEAQASAGSQPPEASRSANTHRAGHEVVKQLGVNRIPNARVVDDGSLISSGGATSGIDLAIYLVERYFGSQAASGSRPSWNSSGAAPSGAPGSKGALRHFARECVRFDA